MTQISVLSDLSQNNKITELSQNKNTDKHFRRLHEHLE